MLPDSLPGKGIQCNTVNHNIFHSDIFVYVDPWLSNQGDKEASQKWHISREKRKDWVQKEMAWARHGETKGSLWSLRSTLLLLYIWGKLPEQSQLGTVWQSLFSVVRWNLFPLLPPPNITSLSQATSCKNPRGRSYTAGTLL